MAFLVASVSVFNNFIPAFTKPETFAFVNNTVINCLSAEKLPCKGMCKSSHD
jgi:hypothetical protein